MLYPKLQHTGTQWITRRLYGLIACKWHSVQPQGSLSGWEFCDLKDHKSSWRNQNRSPEEAVSWQFEGFLRLGGFCVWTMSRLCGWCCSKKSLMAYYVVATEESQTLLRSFGRRCLEMWGYDWKDHVEIDPRAVALDPIAKIFFKTLSLLLMKFQLNTDQSNALRHTHTL